VGNSIGLGGISLVVAAVVWLLIFVPGYANRSQLKASEQMVRAEVRQARRAQPLTAEQRLRRLLNTQRGFSVLFGLSLLGAIATGLAAISDGIWWFAFALATTVATVSLVTQRAAGNQAAKLAAQRHRERAAVRDRTQRQAKPQSREWTPNRLPAPLATNQIGELSAPLADVIEIQNPKRSLTSSEIDAILARRRAI
jgi:lysozyme family protein